MKKSRIASIKSIEEYKGFTIKVCMVYTVFSHEYKECRVYNGDTLVATFKTKKEAKAQIDDGNVREAKKFSILYRELVPGHGYFSAGTEFTLHHEDSNFVYAKFEEEPGYANEIIHRFPKSHIYMKEN